MDSRTGQEGRTVRRRRECLSCERRFTTYEYVEERPLQVVKRDRSVEEYDREKLRRSLVLPCAKRPVGMSEIDEMVEEIEDNLSRLEVEEVPSEVIGELVMERLKTRDHVAYVRFASVYRNFQDIDEFVDELRDLSLRQAQAAIEKSQRKLPL